MTPIPIGQTFNRLTVIADAGRDHCSIQRVKCLCVCGKQTESDLRNVKSGRTKSCGCLRVEMNKSKATHGESDSKEYKAWKAIKDRCENPNCREYKYYGARGIKRCERWKRFEIFLADMGRCPLGYSIERKDNNLGYSPDNCKWATRIEQENNKRTSRLITFNGKTQTLTLWARDLGLMPTTLRQRFNHGWSTERAFTDELR